MTGCSPLPAEQELGLLSLAFHGNNQPAATTPMKPSPENHHSCGHGRVFSTGMVSLRSVCRWGDSGATGVPFGTGRSQQHQRRMTRSHGHPTTPGWYDQVPPSTGVQHTVVAVGLAESLAAAFHSERGSDGHPISPL